MEAGRKKEKSGGKTHDGSPTKAIVISRTGEGKKSVPNGSLLAPSYRNRTTSLRQHNVITISI